MGRVSQRDEHDGTTEAQRSPRRSGLMRCKARAALVAGMILVCAISAWGQQKGQWVPGQFGLNAGVIPDAGIPYANMPINYSASQLNDSNGNRLLQNVTGTYSFWVDENILYYVSHHKILGGYFMPYIVLSYANGQLVAALPPLLPTNTSGINLNSGGSGFAETYIQPVNIGWHFAKRVDFNAGYAFVAPTGRYTAGANNNVGSGYWGNNLTSRHHPLHHQKPGDHGEPCHRLGSARLENGRQRSFGPAQQNHSWAGFHRRVGIWPVLPLKKDMSISGSAWLRWIRSMAGLAQRWHVPDCWRFLCLPATARTTPCMPLAFRRM